jgi:hypothetical protein
VVSRFIDRGRQDDAAVYRLFKVRGEGRFVGIVFTNTFEDPLPSTGADGATAILALLLGLGILGGGAWLVTTSRRRRLTR